MRVPGPWGGPPRHCVTLSAVVTGIHHLGIAVTDLAAACDRYTQLLGGSVEARERLEDQGVEAVSVVLGAGRVELMSPLAEDTPVGRFLVRHGDGLHHVAYSVADLRAELARIAAAGGTLIDTEPRHGLYGAVAFLHFESFAGVLTELVERGDHHV